MKEKKEMAKRKHICIKKILRNIFLLPVLVFLTEKDVPVVEDCFGKISDTVIEIGKVSATEGHGSIKCVQLIIWHPRWPKVV